MNDERRHPDNSPALTSRCGECRALCCILPAFDADQGFGYDKRSNTPCRHLRGDMRCSIHERLADESFTGCIAYDCHGAGQRVSTMLALDSRWFENVQLLQKVYRCFTLVKGLHELMAMLQLGIRRAGGGPDGELIRQELDALASLDNATLLRWTQADLLSRRQRVTALLSRILPVRQLDAD